MSDGLLGVQIDFGRGCVHTVCSRVVSSLLIWESVSIPHTGVYGGSVLLFFLSTQLFRLLLYLTSVDSHNLTPPPPSSKTHEGQEKLCYCTHKSNVYCLYSDNTRSHYQSVVILHILQILNKEVAVPLLLATSVSRSL